MPNNHRFSEEEKREIAKLIDQGWGKRSLAAQYGVGLTVARRWVYTYKSVGLDGLLNMGSTHKPYDYVTKLAAARSRVEDGLSLKEAMAKFGIASPTALHEWCSLYREGGAEALKLKAKGRPKGAKSTKKPESELERLRAENERLRCELEVQKRLNALAKAKR